ncbi:Listeria/Bacterioides repeat-containing protein/Por secretion system C-terminal sorting domain-containing protein [Chitinophaga sp. YR627]|uniref:InlB B-repeat-containing protein n=1 Tax=Chitinophaga sp. YR627 TaxID=1881041 RepID=UPI0008EAD63B|nr:T9SS type A sorting domain-containing protein [Chitinophaga sp. YR627]SFO27444.1 Listeria/Bacterioides repeat-containing protein/Por secretion system C-terminal sorting domain-containing protein [Chitinophaga sp. YR627]
MRTQLLLALACLLGEGMAYAQTPLYVAPGGSASNPGTSINAPTTLATALATIPAGGTIYLRGGTYSLSASVIIPATNNGTASTNKNVVAYSSEVPVLDFSAQAIADANRGLVLDGDYWHFTGITITGAGDNGMLLAGNNNIIEKCIFSKNHDSGLQLSRYVTSNTTIGSWPSNNLILNCEAFDNQDPDNEDADGFAAKLTCGTGNIFRGCISHHNIDDGWDLYAKSDTGPIGPVTIDNCVAYSNGTLSTGSTSGNGDKNGFKLGGSGIAVNHIIRRSVAFNNGHHGFTDNNNPGNIEVTNNTSYNNAESNFNFREGSTATFRNNLSFNAGSSDKSNGTEVGASNVWWKNNVSTNSGGLVVSSADFISTSPSVGKNTDGSPNLGNFLALASGSDMINAGVITSGITYSGSAPDIGARESGSTTNPGTYSLSISASPAAGGTVTASPNAAAYTAGTVVTLTAAPTSGYTFSGWSGAASGTATTTTVTMNSNLAVTASFTASNGGGGGNTLRIDDAATTTSGYCGADGSRQNSYSGADGGYYINLSNSASKGVNYSITVPAAGTYSFVWRYSNGGANVSTTARLLVNGNTAVSSVSFPKTSAWTSWTTTAAVTATLAAGTNTVRIETTASTEFAVIDWLEVTGNSPAAGTCGSSLLNTLSYQHGAEETAAISEAAKVYPNPVVNNATISFYNRKETRVAVKIFDANGALISNVSNQLYPAGQNQINVDCSRLVKAVYFIRVERNGNNETLRVVKQ